MQQEEKYIYMTTTPVPRLIGELAVPTIISMLVTSFYNMADTFFVGRINTQSTAAVGVVFSVMAIIQSLGFFFGHGSGNYISRRLGAKDFEEAAAMAANGFFLAFICGLAEGKSLEEAAGPYVTEEAFEKWYTAFCDTLSSTVGE